MCLAAAIAQFLTGYLATRNRSDKIYKAYACDLHQSGHFAGADAKLTALAYFTEGERSFRMKMSLLQSASC